MEAPDEAAAARSTGTARPARRESHPTSCYSQLTIITGSDSDKKIQQSWGGADGNTELKNEVDADVDAAAEEATNDWSGDAAPSNDWGAPDAAASADAWAAPSGDAPPTAATADGEKPEGRPRREREPEEEDNTLTLEQYLAQQKDKESAIPKLEGTRQANEGADANIWKDVVPLQKEEEDAYFVGKVRQPVYIATLVRLPILCRANPHPRRAPRRRRKYSSRSRRASTAPTVVAGDAAAEEETVEATELVVAHAVAAVAPGVDARPPLSMSTIPPPSPPCPERYPHPTLENPNASRAAAYLLISRASLSPCLAFLLISNLP